MQQSTNRLVSVLLCHGDTAWIATNGFWEILDMTQFRNEARFGTINSLISEPPYGTMMVGGNGADVFDRMTFRALGWT